MRVSNNTLKCDRCSIELIDDFTYYSYDCRKIRVYDGVKPSMFDALAQEIDKSYDICSTCNEEICDRVVLNTRKMLPHLKADRNLTYCEITGKVYSGDYKYYYTTVDKVVVSTKGGSVYCAGCKKPASETKACKCGHDGRYRQSKVNVTKRILDICIDIDSIKSSTNTEWSTK